MPKFAYDAPGRMGDTVSKQKAGKMLDRIFNATSSSDLVAKAQRAYDRGDYETVEDIFDDLDLYL